MNTREEILYEVEKIAQVPIVAKILALVCATTGMRFAAVARVTPEKWVALAVMDQLGFGLKPGDEVEINKTLCSEVRMFEKPIIINDAATDEVYRDNPIPAEFGFKSHISVPIFIENGFYGTLCSIDTEPNQLDN
ncbi:MAG: GAF domain-containing protein, partial [Moraxellaceae bacterium]